MATKVFDSLLSFAKFTEMRSVEANPILSSAVGAAATGIYNKTQEIFGNRDKLRSLTPYTQAERTQKGYSPNEPLVRDGTLKKSIEVMHEGLVAGVGSPDPRMQWHELGYVSIKFNKSVPPRPVLRIASSDAKADNTLVVRYAAQRMLGINVEGGGTTYAVIGGENIVNQFTGELKKPSRYYSKDHVRGNSASS